MSAPRASGGLERGLVPLDRAREGLLRRLARSPRLFAWIRDRDSRATLRALVAVGVSLLLTCFAPALAHVLTDGIHYAFWLGVIPDLAVRGQGTLGFRQTYRGLARDFGRALPWVALAALLVPLLALAGVPEVRAVYFSFAGFHGYLEGALLVHALVSGEKSLSEPASAHACAERDAAFVRTRFPSSAGLG